MGVWDIIDTAAKVATGGAISALTTYWILRRHAGTEPSPLATRRLDILESVAEQVGRVNHVFLKYATLLGELLPSPERMTQAKREELETVSAEMVTAFEGMSTSEAKLLLLGERNLEMALKVYSGRIAQFRRQFVVGRPDIGEADFSAAKRDVAAAREQFYDLLSQRYDSDLQSLED